MEFLVAAGIAAAALVVGFLVGGLVQETLPDPKMRDLMTPMVMVTAFIIATVIFGLWPAAMFGIGVILYALYRMVFREEKRQADRQIGRQAAHR